MAGKTKILTLENFRKKALKKVREKKQFADIEIEGIGFVKFKRPTENVMLEYMDNCAKAVTTEYDESTESNKVIGQDLGLMLDASKELVYSCCSFMQDKELRESLEIKDPLDVVTEILGINGTMDIAGEIVEVFDGVKEKEKVDKEIKN